MAETPSVFTVAPWGYRVLTPWLVHVLPVRNVIRAFRWVTAAGLIAAGALLFVFLRRLGHGEWASLLGVTAFGLSPPVAEVVRYRFLGEPLAVALEVALLVALETDAGPASLALIAALGALAKDSFLVLLPGVYFVRRRRDGDRHALLACGAACGAAVLVTTLLRAWWTPQLAWAPPELGWQTVARAIARLRDTWESTWPAPFLGGLAPVALLGAFRTKARPYLGRYGYLIAVTMLSPFVAWLNVPGPVAVPIFGPNVTRLLVFAVPVVVPLALFALDALRPHFAPAADDRAARQRPGMATIAALLLVLLLPLALLDRYRRVDLRGARDGPLVLAVCRETLRTAGRLDRGLEVRFDAETSRFAWGESDPGQLGRMRWFLREGWGPLAHYGIDAIRMRGDRGVLLVPVLQRRPLEIGLTLQSTPPALFAFDLNGRPIGESLIGTEAQEVTLRVPPELLFRGDNLLGLRTAMTPSAVRLLALRLRQAP